MKLLPSRPQGYFWRLFILIASYFALYQIMASTGMIERVMTFNFEWWELVLIALFLVSRFVTYLFLVPFLIALGIYHGAKALLHTKSHSTSLH